MTAMPTPGGWWELIRRDRPDQPDPVQSTARRASGRSDPRRIEAFAAIVNRAGYAESGPDLRARILIMAARPG